MTLTLYGLTVLIWGTTWIAISLQNGPVDTFVSVFYRFALAGLLMLPLMFALGRIAVTRWRDHSYFVLQGACLFCFNFVCFYTASKSMSSGLISIVFSMAILFNAVNSRIFFKVRPSRSIYLAGLIGVTGLSLLFWQELVQASASPELPRGIALAAIGTYLFSLGNMVSVRNSNASITPFTSNAYAMNYGAIILLAIIGLTGAPMNWDSRPAYLYSLLYLAIPGSIIGFTAYLSLVTRIGANRAAYATVLFPVIALAISSFYESYLWSGAKVIGLVLVMIGNAVALNLLPRSRRRTAVME